LLLTAVVPVIIRSTSAEPSHSHVHVHAVHAHALSSKATIHVHVLHRHRVHGHTRHPCYYTALALVLIGYTMAQHVTAVVRVKRTHHGECAERIGSHAVLHSHHHLHLIEVSGTKVHIGIGERPVDTVDTSSSNYLILLISFNILDIFITLFVSS
jgi:hypothetical protein